MYLIRVMLFCILLLYVSSFQMKKHNEVLSQIHDLEIQLQKALASVNKSLLEQDKEDDDEEDALDAFMMKLSTPASDKKLVTRTKVNILIQGKLQYAMSVCFEMGTLL